MPLVRYSVMTPKAGQADHLRSLLGQLLEFDRHREGFLLGFLLDPERHAVHTFLGRATVWASEAYAMESTLQQRHIALQSEIMQTVAEGTYDERSLAAKVWSTMA